MQYLVDEPLRNFKFWSGAKDRADQLTGTELDQIEEQLPEILSENPTDTEINDLFWFDFPTVVGLIGLKVNDAEDIVRDDDAAEETDAEVENFTDAIAKLVKAFPGQRAALKAVMEAVSKQR